MHLRISVSAAAVALMAAFGGAGAQKVFVAPTRDNIFSDTEVREGNAAAHLIYVSNRSSVPITVFSVVLTDCENVKLSCGPKRTNIRIRAGQRVQVIRVEPRNLNDGFSYRFNFSFNADSTDDAARAALGITKELTPDDFRKLGPRIASFRPDPDSIMVPPGTQVSLERVRFMVLDSSGKVLGHTRWAGWRGPSTNVAEFVGGNRFVARRLGRFELSYYLADEAQQLMGRPVNEFVLPVIVGYPLDPHAPVFTGLALDGDTKKPLGCTSVALEDSAHNEVATERTQPNGMFVLQAPKPGTYRVRVDLHGWAPAYGDMVTAGADEEKQMQYLVRFTEQMLVQRNPFESTFQHATPAAVSTRPVGSRPGTRTAVAPAITLGGSPSMPILGVISAVPPATVWAQFVIDSLGQVDTTSIVVPQGTSANARTNVGLVLPRVRFSPARNDGRPVCELVRLQVNFTPR